jgi:hypothetical protein
MRGDHPVERRAQLPGHLLEEVGLELVDLAEGLLLLNQRDVPAEQLLARAQQLVTLALQPPALFRELLGQGLGLAKRLGIGEGEGDLVGECL